jgi:hypothetical protein
MRFFLGNFIGKFLSEKCIALYVAITVFDIKGEISIKEKNFFIFHSILMQSIYFAK